MNLSERILRRLPVTRDLYADLDAAQETIARLSDPEMKDLRLDSGGINMIVAGPMIERLALAMAGYFRESGAQNYVEMNLNARDAPYERYAVTVQKIGQKSPDQFREEAEAEVARLRAQLAIASCDRSPKGGDEGSVHEGAVPEGQTPSPSNPSPSPKAAIAGGT